MATYDYPHETLQSLQPAFQIIDRCLVENGDEVSIANLSQLLKIPPSLAIKCLNAFAVDRGSKIVSTFLIMGKNRFEDSSKTEVLLVIDSQLSEGLATFLPPVTYHIYSIQLRSHPTPSSTQWHKDICDYKKELHQARLQNQKLIPCYASITPADVDTELDGIVAKSNIQLSQTPDNQSISPGSYTAISISPSTVASHTQSPCVELSQTSQVSPPCTTVNKLKRSNTIAFPTNENTSGPLINGVKTSKKQLKITSMRQKTSTPTVQPISNNSLVNGNLFDEDEDSVEDSQKEAPSAHGTDIQEKKGEKNEVIEIVSSFPSPSNPSTSPSLSLPETPSVSSPTPLHILQQVTRTKSYTDSGYLVMEDETVVRKTPVVLNPTMKRKTTKPASKPTVQTTLQSFFKKSPSSKRM